ncbi:excinuclease [Nostoc sp. 'Peltigera membranacea cyanobiont' 210A]|uniref:AAA family ATPase n=1 Tax=Nostoc sp. 'Peltigera membranacea cyanobiont' 210A TaxID=2014529 RepID=UPI000B95ADC3|nr:AAA family ATPase [Nostoc sp. 'Peltigera membranacea cyanobiont' 210A]OYD89582.1 excinuclease [Nostoc sp. 'Peltigera membranacea cyanobiont' 210A]
MRIKQISVSGLFGIFDHVIPLNMDERITIIHGPNGFGKTAILRILNALFNSQYAELKTIPFKLFRLAFDDSSNIEIIKNNDDSEQAKNNIVLKFSQPDSEPVHFYLKSKINQDNRELRSIYLNYYIKSIKTPLKSLDLGTEETLLPEKASEEAVEEVDNLWSSIWRSQEEPDWLEQLKSNIHIRLIESQRLLNFVPNRSSRRSAETPSILSTVSAYSDELAKLMQDKFKEYGIISQSLDRTFPIRVVKQQPSTDLTDEQLRHQLNELEATRSRLIEVGLLDKDEDAEFQIQPQDIDESTKNALSVYVQDVEKKLSVFAEIASKIDLLRKIINNKFAYSYKEINFSKEKGFVVTTSYGSSLSNSKTLLPTDLSSGEQHELVLLYELLFKVQPNSLVLIDEPELSLHVGWQVQFLKDLQDITQLADLNILMATHSPDIIQDRWDLTVELKGPQK